VSANGKIGILAKDESEAMYALQNSDHLQSGTPWKPYGKIEEIDSESCQISTQGERFKGTEKQSKTRAIHMQRGFVRIKKKRASRTSGKGSRLRGPYQPQRLRRGGVQKKSTMS